MIGIVTKSTGSWYRVKYNSEIIECRIKGKFRLDGLKTTNPVAVGDVVEFNIDEEKKEGVIVRIEPRRNYLIRKSVNLSKKYHIIAANIDQAIIIASVSNPVTTLEFIDRFLISTEAYGIPTTIIVNKIDLLSEQDRDELAYWLEIYDTIGYKVILTSATKKQNFEEIKELLKGKTTVVSGHSGVGKSSLLNILCPGLDIKTSEISDMHKQGKHTTTFAEMHELDFGGAIIDTPGIRGLGVVDIEKEELADFFPEFLVAKANCKFYNCKHLNEPDCEVKKLVEEGEIYPSRYRSYLSILEESSEIGYR